MISYLIDKYIFENNKLNNLLPSGSIELILGSLISIGVILYTNYV